MFEVKYKKIVLLLLSFLIFFWIACILVIFLSIRAKGNEWLIFICVTVFLLLMYVLGAIDFFRHKIIVNDGRIAVRKMFGKMREYLFEDIKYYEDFKIYKRRIYVYFNNGESITVNNFYTNYEAFAERIRKTGKLKKRV